MRNPIIPENCEEKMRLLVAYQTATDAYSKAVAELVTKMGVTRKAEYEALNTAAEQTRLASFLVNGLIRDGGPLCADACFQIFSCGRGCARNCLRIDLRFLLSPIQSNHRSAAERARFREHGKNLRQFGKFDYQPFRRG